MCVVLLFFKIGIISYFFGFLSLSLWDIIRKLFNRIVGFVKMKLFSEVVL